MHFAAIQVFFLGFLPNLLAAQGSQDSENPLTVPACATMLSIVDSCESKLLDANTITASVFSCLCYDGSGNYIPAVYDNAVAGCSSALPTDSADFGFWLPGLCTDANYATNTAAGSTTAGGSATAVGGLTGTPTITSTGAKSSSSPAVNPSGLISNTSSTPTSMITPAPTSTGNGSVSHVSSTSSKAEGMKIAYRSHDASFLSIFGSILGAILML